MLVKPVGLNMRYLVLDNLGALANGIQILHIARQMVVNLLQMAPVHVVQPRKIRHAQMIDGFSLGGHIPPEHDRLDAHIGDRPPQVRLVLRKHLFLDIIGPIIKSRKDWLHSGKQALA